MQSVFAIGLSDSKDLFKLYVIDIKEMIPNILRNFHSLSKQLRKMDCIEYDPKVIPNSYLLNDKADQETKDRALRATKPLLLL